jgi:hypothetical protein
VRETQIPQAIGDGANEAGQPVSRPLSRPSPTANLAGNWKGDPLIREVRGLKFTPNKNVMALSRSSWLRCVLDKNYAGRDLHRNSGLVFCGIRALCVRLRKTLTRNFYGKLNSRDHFRRALRLFNLCNGAA